MKGALFFILIGFVSSTSMAGFLLDCGNPLESSGIATTEGYKLEFNNSDAILRITKKDGSEVKTKLYPDYAAKDYTVFYSHDQGFGNLSILSNGSYWLNISDLYTPSKWHSECK